MRSVSKPLWIARHQRADSCCCVVFSEEEPWFDECNRVFEGKGLSIGIAMSHPLWPLVADLDPGESRRVVFTCEASP